MLLDFKTEVTQIVAEEQDQQIKDFLISMGTTQNHVEQAIEETKDSSNFVADTFAKFGLNMDSLVSFNKDKQDSSEIET